MGAITSWQDNALEQKFLRRKPMIFLKLTRKQSDNRLLVKVDFSEKSVIFIIYMHYKIRFHFIFILEVEEKRNKKTYFYIMIRQLHLLLIDNEYLERPKTFK